MKGSIKSAQHAGLDCPTVGGRRILRVRRVACVEKAALGRKPPARTRLFTIYFGARKIPKGIREESRRPSSASWTNRIGGQYGAFEIDKDRELRTLAETVDDAAGEALDKGAKLLGMPYPGAPLLEKIARNGKVDKSLFPYGQNRKIEEDPNFSFSGLKTSLRYYLQKCLNQKSSKQCPISAPATNLR